MWCMHSIFSVESDFLGTTTRTCENVLRSRLDAFLQVWGQKLNNIRQKLSAEMMKILFLDLKRLYMVSNKLQGHGTIVLTNIFINKDFQKGLLIATYTQKLKMANF